MLNELMGSGRNDQNEDGEMPTTSTRFEDPDVCRPFLLKCCPHDVLTSTRADIGDCTLEHSLALRSDYERARQKNNSLMYEFDAHRALKKFIDETDERIELSKTKLAEKQADISKEIEEKANGVHEINEKIGKLLADAEKAGMEGEVGKSQEVSPPCLKVATFERYCETLKRCAKKSGKPNKTTATRCRRHFFNNKDCASAKFAHPIWDSMTMTGAWLIISAESCIWDSSTCANGLTT